VFPKDNNDESIAIGVCYSVYPNLGVGSDGPLDMNKVAVQIVDVLVVEDRTSNWMFTLCAWNITNTFYSGASLYDHDQVAMYMKALEDCNSRKRAGRRQFEYTRRPKLPMRMTKAERLLSMEDINLVSSKICCKLNCMQPYLREKILPLSN
jgi:hypothetical protein